MSLGSCRDTARLVSRSLDHALKLSQRVTMRLHLLLCPRCARYRKHLLLLRDAAQRVGANSSDHAYVPLPALSPEARARIKSACENIS